MKVNRHWASITFWSMSACVLLSGCLSTGNDRLFDPATVAKLTPRETTKAQVITLLGLPNYQRQTIMAGHSYEWWGYAGEQSTVNPIEYLLVVGLFFNGIGTPDARRDLGLFFDPDGVLTHVHHQATTYETGGIVTPLNISSKVQTAMSRPDQPGGPTLYQDAMAVSPGP